MTSGVMTQLQQLIASFFIILRIDVSKRYLSGKYTSKISTYLVLIIQSSNPLFYYQESRFFYEVSQSIKPEIFQYKIIDMCMNVDHSQVIHFWFFLSFSIISMIDIIQKFSVVYSYLTTLTVVLHIFHKISHVSIVVTTFPPSGTLV